MINLLYSGNAYAYDGILLSLISVTKYYKGALSVYILTMDLSEEKSAYKPISDSQGKIIEDYMKSVNKHSALKIIDVKELYLKYLSGGKNEKSSYTPYAFIRLLIGEIKTIPDKTLYLDYDTVAMDDIKKLYDTDVREYEFAAAKDYYGRFFIAPNYVNSGVMLLNVKRMKECRTFSKCLAFVKNKKMLLPDQTALNKCVRKKLILKRRFNEQHKLKPDTVIRHFSMTIKFFPRIKTRNIKPWDIEKLHSVLNEYALDDVLNIYLEIKNKQKTGL